MDSNKTELQPDITNKEVFERELALCRTLYRENDGKCGWGKCADCGVIPLLFRLHKGQLLEDPDEIMSIKKSILK